jgi:hypothetical protein
MFWASLRSNRFDSHPVLLCGCDFDTGMLVHGLLIEQEPAKARPPKNAGYVVPKPGRDEEAQTALNLNAPSRRSTPKDSPFLHEFIAMEMDDR